MHVSNIPIDELKPFTRNPKKHPEKQIKFLQKSFKEFGWTNPILVAQDNMIVAGHGRWEAAKQAGFTEVPVIKLDMPYEKAVAYVIADNHLAELAETDTEQLAELLQEISQIEDFDIEATGFEMDDIDDIINELHPKEIIEDEVPGVPEEAVTQRGDVWELGRHRLMCGNSLDVANINLLLDGNVPDTVFTDPPYGISIVSKDGSVGGGTRGKYKPIIGDASKDVAIAAFGICSDMGFKQMFFWGANHYSSHLPDSSCRLVWDKQGGKSVTFADCELCYTNLNSPVRMFTHIWDGFRRDSEKGEMRVHPTQKPIQLIVDIFDRFDTPGMIADFFGGSGSTLIACEQTNRINYSMEIDPHYCDVIIQRYVNLTGNTELTRNGEPYTWQVKEK